MVIGIANNLFPPYGRGSGAEVIAAKQAAELRAAGHDVFIVSLSPQGISVPDSPNHFFLPSSYSGLGKKKPYSRLAWHLRELLCFPQKRALARILEERRPELFITHNLVGIGFGLPALLAEKGIRHEHVLHDIQLLHPSGLMYWGQEGIIDSLPARLYQTITRHAFRRCRTVISPSKWLLSVHESKGFFSQAEKIHRPNFSLARREPKPANKPFHFVFSGQLEKHKGLELLLSAWQRADLLPEEARLTIAGGGRLEDIAKEAAANLANVEYAGLLDRNGIDALLDSADAVVVPSLVYENSPTSLWEAAEHGCRGLASDIGGIPELSSHLELKLFPPGNADALIAALKSYTHDN
ncbi:MAG: glycosyltransferase [Bacillota bacterium]